MAKKKRAVGRPRNTTKRVPKLLNYSERSIQTLAALTERYRVDAPDYIQMSDRAVIEALIHYADREELSFAELFLVPQEAAN